jgi:uncharacterized protein HemY
MAPVTEDITEEERELALIEAERLLVLGRIEWEEGRYAEATNCFERALLNFRSLKHQIGITQALGHLGNNHHAQGQNERAIAHHTN